MLHLHPIRFSILCCLLVALIAASCGSPRRAPTVSERVDFTDQDVENGRLVFMNYCNRCHPGGTAGLGPAINNKPLPGFLIKYQVRQGLGVMPAFKKEVISPDKLDDLVTYLKELRKIDERES